MVAALSACTPSIEDHVADVCREASETSEVPCDKTPGQMRQWLSDEGEKIKPGWKSAVLKADTVSKLHALWRCRREDGNSWFYFAEDTDCPPF